LFLPNFPWLDGAGPNTHLKLTFWDPTRQLFPTGRSSALDLATWVGEEGFVDYSMPFIATQLNRIRDTELVYTVQGLYNETEYKLIITSDTRGNLMDHHASSEMLGHPTGNAHHGDSCVCASSLACLRGARQPCRTRTETTGGTRCSPAPSGTSPWARSTTPTRRCWRWRRGCWRRTRRSTRKAPRRRRRCGQGAGSARRSTGLRHDGAATR